jgi:parallel beta-helix repeat protein
MNSKSLKKVFTAILPGLIVAGLIFGANVYYDLDLGKVIVQEITKIIGMFETTATTTLATVSGYVGIATSTPTEALTVSGNVLSTGNLTISGGKIFGANQEELWIGFNNDLIQVVRGPTPTTYIVCDSSGNCAGNYNYVGGTGTPNYLAKFSATSTLTTSTITEIGGVVNIPGTTTLATTAGFVGIATSTPYGTEKLTVYGNIWGSGNIILQKGSYNITLTPATLTANRTITFPDLSGTVAVSSTAPITLSSTGVIGLTTPLAISFGGTATSSIGSAGSVVYSNGTTYAFTSVGIAGQPLLSGGSGAPTWGTLSVSFGGTGLTSVASGALLYGSGGTTLNTLSLGSPGTILTASTSAPYWASLSSLSIATGTGAANYIAKWTGTNTLSTSTITDTGTLVNIPGTTTLATTAGFVGIATSTPYGTEKLTVYGNIWGSGNIILQKGSYNITLTPATLTANRTITFPDLSGTVAVSSTAPITLSSTGVIGLTTPLAISFGGTATSSIGSAGSVVYSNGTTYAFTSVGIAGQPLLSGGSGAPTWGTLGTTYGGTGQNWSTVATGSLPYFSGYGTLGTLALGSPGTILTASTSAPYWASLSSLSIATGTGAANYIAKWTGTNTLSTSTITDTGTLVNIPGTTTLATTAGFVGIATSTPYGTEKLTVYGNIWGSGNIILQKGSYNITLTPATLTANRTITFPDLSGTVAVSSTAPITLSSTGVIGLTTPLAISFGGTATSSIGSAGSVVYSNGTTYAFTSVGIAGQPLLSGGSGAPTWGTLSVSFGGTGLTSVASGALLYGSGGTTLNTLSLGSPGTILTASTSAPYWASLSSLSIATGTGAANYIAKWTGANTLATSTITDDGSLVLVSNQFRTTATTTLATSGGYVGIGTSAPLYTLDVNGSLRLRPISAPTATSGVIYYDSTADKFKCYQQGGIANCISNGVATIIVAASDSQQKYKADYICSGSGDQTTINNAISALPSGGGIIYLLEGTYNLTGPITITKSNVAIIGSGKATVLKRMWNSSSAEGVITVGDGTNAYEGILISNLQIDGNKGSYANSYNHGIFFKKYITKSKIKGNWIQNSAGNGIYFYATASGESNSYNIIEGNDIRSNSYYGIFLYYSSYNIISGNTVQGNSSSGILLSSSSNNTVSGNTVQGNTYYGIYIYSSSNNTISGNTVQGNNQYGIYLSSTSNNNTITGNTVQGNSYHGISLYSSSNNTISGNTVQGNNQYGIYLFSTSNNNTITGNTVQGNSYHGIYLESSSNNTISGNKIHDNGGSGAYSGIYISSNSDANLISSNDITDTAGTGYAINIYDSTCDNNYLVGNRYSYPSGYNTISDSGTGTIYGSQLYGSDLILKPLGNVGIGTTGPDRKLDVLDSSGSPQLRLTYTDGSVYTDFFTSSTGILIIDTSLTNDTVYIGPNPSATGTLAVYKITTYTLDPLYTINGKTFATYAPSMTGVKEETTGVIKVEKMVEGKDYYQAEIDFNNLEEGSDLWLFSKVTALRKNIDKLSVLLTPAGRTRVWYQVDPQNFKLYFFAERPTTISYRLTAPRWDYEKWSNFAEGEGVVINEDGLVVSSSTVYQYSEENNEEGILEKVVSLIKETLEKLGLIIENGIAQIKEIITEKLSAKVVVTNQLCLGQTCIDEAKLKELLEKTGTMGTANNQATNNGATSNGTMNNEATSSQSTSTGEQLSNEATSSEQSSNEQLSNEQSGNLTETESVSNNSEPSTTTTQ